jgi:hypothetical protein
MDRHLGPDTLRVQRNRSETAAREALNWFRGMGKLGQQVLALVRGRVYRTVVVGVLRQFAVVDLEHPWSLLDVHNVGFFKWGLATVYGFGGMIAMIASPPF